MNIIEINVDAMIQAGVALLGEEKARILNDVYVLLNTAEHRGYEQGKAQLSEQTDTAYQNGFNEGRDVEKMFDDLAYEEGHKDGFKEGFETATDEADADYQRGFQDGCGHAENCTEEVYEDAYNIGYNTGYDHSRNELGECPIVDQDFDEEYGIDLVWPTDYKLPG